MERIDRRRFLGGAVAALSLGRSSLGQGAPRRMEPWCAGWLDIHHISTGRGNSVLMVCPDGTSVMIDAGAVGGTDEAMGPARPDGSRRPGEWIGRYALRQLQTTPRQELDYFVLTHLHGDHMGDVLAASPQSGTKGYRLTGVTDVAEAIPIRCLIDRGFPDYAYPAPTSYEGALNYMRFAKFAERHGTRVERLKVGSARQIGLQHGASRYPGFAIQNLAANGEVWTGRGEETVKLFPDLGGLKPGEMPTENACSIALRVSSGAFRYYIGGDLTCDTRFGSQPWMDVETAVAKVAGPVSVSALDHHGYYDATCPAFVRSMQSRVYVMQTWHASHPALLVLDELYSPILQAGARDVFATGLVAAAELAEARLADKMLSQRGHVVIRVAEGGGSFEVFVVDDAREDGDLLRRWGPYRS